MYLYVELWNVTQDWMDLSKEERAEFFEGVQTGLKELANAGIENVGWAMNDEHAPHRSDYRYIAVWKIQSLDAVEALEKGVAESGWHNYFSQQNSRGKIMPMAEALDFLVNINRESSSLTE